MKKYMKMEFDVLADNFDVCEECANLRQKLDGATRECEQLRKQQMMVIGTTKKKILATDKIIREFQQKKLEYEAQTRKVEELGRLVDQLHRDLARYENDYATALAELQPMRKISREREEQLRTLQDSNDRWKNKAEAAEILNEQLTLKLNHLELQMGNLGDPESITKEKTKLQQKLDTVQKQLKEAKDSVAQHKRDYSALQRKYKNAERNAVRWGSIADSKGLLLSRDKKALGTMKSGSDVTIEHLDDAGQEETNEDAAPSVEAESKLLEQLLDTEEIVETVSGQDEQDQPIRQDGDTNSSMKLPEDVVSVLPVLTGVDAEQSDVVLDPVVTMEATGDAEKKQLDVVITEVPATAVSSDEADRATVLHLDETVPVPAVEERDPVASVNQVLDRSAPPNDPDIDELQEILLAIKDTFQLPPRLLTPIPSPPEVCKVPESPDVLARPEKPLRPRCSFDWTGKNLVAKEKAEQFFRPLPLKSKGVRVGYRRLGHLRLQRVLSEVVAKWSGVVNYAEAERRRKKQTKPYLAQAVPVPADYRKKKKKPRNRSLFGDSSSSSDTDMEAADTVDKPKEKLTKDQLFGGSSPSSENEDQDGDIVKEVVVPSKRISQSQRRVTAPSGFCRQQTAPRITAPTAVRQSRPMSVPPLPATTDSTTREETIAEAPPVPSRKRIAREAKPSNAQNPAVSCPVQPSDSDNKRPKLSDITVHPAAVDPPSNSIKRVCSEATEDKPTVQDAPVVVVEAEEMVIDAVENSENAEDSPARAEGGNQCDGTLSHPVGSPVAKLEMTILENAEYESPESPPPEGVVESNPSVIPVDVQCQTALEMLEKLLREDTTGKAEKKSPAATLKKAKKSISNTVSQFFKAGEISTEFLSTTVDRLMKNNLNVLVRHLTSVVAKDSNSELDTTFTPPAPPLTHLQQRCAILLRAMDSRNLELHPEAQISSITDNFLECVRTTAFQPNATYTIEEMCALARLYTAICRSLGRMNQARCFLYDALYILPSRSYAMAYTVLSVWAEVLQHSTSIIGVSALEQAIVYLLTSCNKIKAVPGVKGKVLQVRGLLRAAHGYEASSVSSLEALVSFVVTKMKETRFLDEATSLSAALDLVTQWEGIEWACEILIKQHLWPLFQQWSCGHGEDIVAVGVISSIGRICSRLPEEKKNVATSIAGVLKNVTDQFENVSREVQEAVVEALLLLTRESDPQLILAVLRQWTPQEISVSLRNQLLDFRRRLRNSEPAV